MKPALRTRGLAPRHGHVVDGAVDGQIADAAPGKEERLHHVGVGREGQPAAVQGDGGRVVQFAVPAATGGAGTVEGGQEEVLDELGREPAAATVAHEDAFVIPQRQGARPGGEIGAIDPVSQRSRPRPGPRSSRRYWW